MSLYAEELQEQVLTACTAVVYVLDASLNNWKAVDEQGGLSNVQLIQTRQNSLYRIRGRLQSNSQITINVVLEKDVTYEVNDGDKSCHCLTSHINVFCLKISPESNGDQFAVVVRSILRRLQDNPSSPREAWMPASVAPQPTVQLQSVKDHLLNSSNLGNKSPFQAQTLLRPQSSLPPQRTFQPQNKSSISDQHLTQSRNQGFAASTTSLVPSARPWYNAQKIGSWKHEFEVDQWCDRLSSAIQEGNIETATEISKLMAEHNAALSIKQKNPKIITVNAGEDSFNLRVVVEDRETSGGAFAMKVSSTTTVTQLQEEVAERYGFPPKVQKWISGMKMAKPQETLSDLKLKRTGSTIYLYLVSGQSVGLKRQEFEHYVNKQEERKNAGLSMSMEMRTGDIQPPPVPSSALSGTQLSRTASLPSLPTVGQSIGSSASSNTVSTTPAAVTGIPVSREAQVMNPSQPAGNPANRARIYSTPSISDLQQMIATFGNEGLSNAPELSRMNERPSVAVEEREVHVQPQGWLCSSCTYMNTPTRPGCEMCGEDRPQDYVVPQNPQITEQEKARLEKERQETESFQRTLDRQQQEKEEAREVNFRQLMQAAQQSIISNTEAFDCAICFMSVEPGDGVVLRECLHCFCRECLREHIRNCTDPEVQCPFQDNNFACHFVITAQEIKALLQQEDFNKFLNRSLVTAESQAANSFHCKTPNCPGWCIYEDNSNVFHCPVCQKVNCLTCKAIHHPEMNCKEYQEDLTRRAENDVAAKQTQKFLEEMITKGDAMKCPQCAIILLKKDGCDWMRCSMCRMEICWATRGPRWGPQGVGDLSGGCKCRVGGKKCHPKCRNCH